MIRLFHRVPSPAPERLTLEGPPHHYLAHVLRLRPGDALEVFDGEGRAFPARVVELEKASAVLALGPAAQVPPVRPITLVQGLPKGEKLELILQKGTELGASAFALAACARCVVKLPGDKAEPKLARWRKISEEAARQCGRSDVPPVLAPAPLVQVCAALDPATAVFVLDEEERAVPLSQAFAAVRAERSPVALVIGPEGGLTREEVAALTARGARAVTLGSSILRTETAGLAALCVLLHLDGRLG